MQNTALPPRSMLSPRWLVMLQGFVTLLVGVLLVTETRFTLVLLIQILGFYWLIRGILELASIIIDSSQWGWKVLYGVLGIVAGLIVVRDPLWSALFIPATLIVFFGVLALVNGCIGLILFFSGAGSGALLTGIISLIIGLLTLSAPYLAVAVVTTLIGVFCIIAGLLSVLFAFRMPA